MGNAGPYQAFRGIECNNCNTLIDKGDKIYIVSNEKLCELCAYESGCVCKCGNYKGEIFDMCHECNRKSKKIYPSKFNTGKEDG